MNKHALLSASSAYRWLKCSPSAKLEEIFEDKTSVFAAEGTAAHTLAEHKLRIWLGQKSQKTSSEFDDGELDYYTDIYFNFATKLILEATEKCKDPIILIEQKLDYSCFVPEGFGTGDLVIVADRTLDIVDLKYGKGLLISAKDNPQMKLYAVGALNVFDSLYDIKKVRMTICQPRLDNISTYEISVDELLYWAEMELKPKAELAFEGKGKFVAGEHCRFCKARQNCEVRLEHKIKNNTAEADFKEEL